MEKNKQTKNRTALVTQELGTDLSFYQKDALAKLLIPVLLTEDCHQHKNLSYELPTDFCDIFKACSKLKEKNDESYITVHRFFLRCHKNSWEKISFFDIYDTLTILLYVAETKYSDSLKKNLEFICNLTKDLYFLYTKYYHLISKIFPNSKDENIFKKILLLSLCISDRNEFFRIHKINKKINLINTLSENPYK